MLALGIPLCTSLTHAPHLNALYLHALHLNALYLHALYLNAIFVVYCSALYVHKRARLGGFWAPGGGKGEISTGLKKSFFFASNS